MFDLAVLAECSADESVVPITVFLDFQMYAGGFFSLMATIIA